jgi:FkbM family methyltransferase
MSLTSYAENFQDVVLQRALGGVDKGFYIDVGAADPHRDSVTQAFYERGWHGINIEPSITHQLELRKRRPADLNLAVAIGADDGVCDFYELPGTPLSTRDARLAQEYSAGGREVLRRQVETATLATLCQRHAGDVVHFLNIDIGGQDETVLEGFDLQRWRPWIIVLNRAGDAALNVLQAAAYTLVYADGQNQYYLAAEHTGLMATPVPPPHPADNFVLCEDHPYSHPLTEWRQRTAAAEAAATEARAWAQAHVLEWKQKHALLTEQERLTSRAQAELTVMTQRAVAAEGQIPPLTARAVHAGVVEQELAAVYATLSWRITRPLREGKFLLSRLSGRLRRLPSRLRGALIRRSKGLLGRVLRYVNARPALSFFLRRNISRFPFMVPAMRALKLRLQLGNNHAAAETAPAAGLGDLPDAARQVFDDLRRSQRRIPHP